MKNVKRVLALALALIMMVGLAACGGNNNTESKPSESKGTSAETKESKKQDETKATEGKTEPAEPITVTIGIPASSRVVDYETNAYTRWLEETTGYSIDFVPFDSKEYMTQLNTMMAGGEKLPDVLLYFSGIGAAIRREMGEDGYLLNIQPYLEDDEFMSNFDLRERVGDTNLYPAYINELFWKIGLEADGSRYGLNNLMYESTDIPRSLTYINKTWLDKLNEPVPTTLDDLHRVLLAFRDNDMNGNGDKSDEIPMIGSVKFNADNIGWLMCNFTYVNDNYWYALDKDGQLYLPHITNEYREGLKMLNQWYKEGLISPLNFTMGSWNEMRAMVTTPDNVAITGMFTGHSDLGFVNETPLLFEYVPLPPLEGAYAALNGPQCTCQNFVTTDAENPEAALTVLLTLMSEEGSLRSFYGEYGVDWEWGIDADDGHKGVVILNANAFSDPALTQTYGVNGCMTMTLEGNSSMRVAFPNKEAMTWGQKRTALLNDHMKKYFAQAEKSNPEKIFVGGVSQTKEESEEYSLYSSDFFTYLRQARADFITGEKDPNSDADWAAHLKQVEDLHLADLLKIQQAAYDRMYK